MGNAKDFLKEEETKVRRGHHKAVCEKKIDDFKKNGGKVTKCDDAKLIKHGASGVLRVNERFEYRTNLKGISSRRFAEREQKPCACCKEMFTPSKRRVELRVAEKELGLGKYTHWCKVCTAKGTAYRDRITALGGYEEYQTLLEENMIVDDVAKLKSLRPLFEQLDIKTKLGKGTRMVEKMIDHLIEEAYKTNEQFGIKHYDFDF